MSSPHRVPFSFSPSLHSLPPALLRTRPHRLDIQLHAPTLAVELQVRRARLPSPPSLYAQIFRTPTSTSTPGHKRPRLGGSRHALDIGASALRYPRGNHVCGTPDARCRPRTAAAVHGRPELEADWLDQRCKRSWLLRCTCCANDRCVSTSLLERGPPRSSLPLLRVMPFMIICA